MSDFERKSRRQQWLAWMAGGGGLGPCLLRPLASAGSAAYAMIMRARNRAFDTALLTVRRLPRPVISVGNLSVGGTGKTVLVAEIARWIRNAGFRPAVLLRGYKGKRVAGQRAGPAPVVAADEADMLGELLGDSVAIAPDPNRYAAGLRLLAGPKPPDIFVLDDGFQHRRLHRDLDIVTIDATLNLAGPLARVLPRGMLREPIRGLARADAIVITRADQADEAAVAVMRKRIAAAAGEVPILQSRHAVTGLARLGHPAEPGDAGLASRNAFAAWQELAGQAFLAFAGIGNPDAFRRTLAQLPGTCVGFVEFDDHYNYGPQEICGLAERAQAAGAAALVTTRKDLVKLDAGWTDMPIFAVNVELAWIDDVEPLRRMVLGLLPSKGQTT